MQYIQLGNSDLQVSRICMGCMGFGDASNGQHSWTIDEEHSREIIKRGLELGVNFFDTAIGYQSGTSEQYVGRALRDFAKRDDVVVATKFLPRTQDEIKAGITGQQHIQRMIDKSLENLGMFHLIKGGSHVILLNTFAGLKARIARLAWIDRVFPQRNLFYRMAGFSCAAGKFITEQIGISLRPRASVYHNYIHKIISFIKLVFPFYCLAERILWRR